jgi:hypothetical protein
MALERPDERDVADRESNEHDDKNDRDLHVRKTSDAGRTANYEIASGSGVEALPKAGDVTKPTGRRSSSRDLYASSRVR